MEPPPRRTPSLRLTFPISLPTSRTSRSRITATPAITKVKIIISYQACKCDSSIAVEACGVAILREVVILAYTAFLQFRWLAQPLPHGLFVGEILVFLLFRGKLAKHANHRMRQDAVYGSSRLIIWNMEWELEAKRCQESHFNYCMQYSLQI